MRVSPFGQIVINMHHKIDIRIYSKTIGIDFFLSKVCIQKSITVFFFNATVVFATDFIYMYF